jgi:hypothetical protein
MKDDDINADVDVHWEQSMGDLDLDDMRDDED